MDEHEIKIPKKSRLDKLFDSTLDFVFSKDPKKWLILIVIFGFLFRLINVKNSVVLGDPPHFCINAINFLDSGLLVTWDQSVFLWHALTDISYKIFGITQFTCRFSSLLFGTLTIIAIYLLTKEFSGNKKIALISALIYAFARTFIVHVADEQDVSVLFFIIMMFYFLVKGLKQRSKFYFLSSSILFGVACMWKAYVPVLIVPYLGLIAYYAYTKRFNLKKDYRMVIYALLLIFLLCMPTLAYNYLNFKHNGVPTFFFVKYLGGEGTEIIQNLYGWVSSGELYQASISLIEFIKQGFIRANSLLIHSYFLWGILFISICLILFKKNRTLFEKDYLVFFLLYFIIPYLIIVNGNYLSKHFFQFLALGIPLISNLIFNIYKRLNKIFNLQNLIKKKFLIFILIILLIEFFIVLSVPPLKERPSFFLQNPEGVFFDYKFENIPENAFIIYDERIYNSLATWLFNDRYYISTVNFGEFDKYNQKSSNKQNIPVFIVECGIGECGWASNPSLGNFSENFFSSIRNNSIPEVLTIKELVSEKYYNPLFSKEPERRDYFKIYKTHMPIDLNLADQFKKQYGSFLYPLGYENKQQPAFQNFIYYPEGFFETMLNKFAWFIFYLEILLSLFAIPLILYELHKQ